MRPHWHFCGMVAAASIPPSPSSPQPTGRCQHFPGPPPMHLPPELDSRGMDAVARGPR